MLNAGASYSELPSNLSPMLTSLYLRRNPRTCFPTTTPDFAAVDLHRKKSVNPDAKYIYGTYERIKEVSAVQVGPLLACSWASPSV